MNPLQTKIPNLYEFASAIPYKLFFNIASKDRRQFW